MICPATGNVEGWCTTSGSAITVIGIDGKTYNSILSPIAGVIAVAGYLNDNGGAPNPSSKITVTVHKEWIRDVNGNPTDANYSYTFTTGS